MKCSTVCLGVVAVVSIALIGGGAVLYKIFPDIVNNQVKENLNLETKSGMSFENWQKGSVPLQMKFYFFNVTNAHDVVKHNAVPKLEEKGPYFYIETREKNISDWNSENGTVDYQHRKTYVFDQSRSNGAEDDIITIPNVPGIAIAKAARMEAPDLKSKLDAILWKEKLYVSESVSTLLFDGYFYPFAKLVADASKREILPDNTFAFFYKQNASFLVDGNFSIHTGKKDVGKYTVIDKWNGEPRLNFWKPNSHCNDINGTDGTQFPPFIKKDWIPRVYVPEICRSTYLIYEKEVENEGILNYRFTSDLGLMADPAINPDNECFCEKDECMYTGLISMNKCQKDAPVFMSPPHFYQSSPLLLKAVEGLQPSKEKHGVYVDIEPMTGTVMNARRTSQINVAMETLFPEFADCEMSKMPRLMHPVLWLSEGATIDSPNADKFKSMAVTPAKIGKGVIYGVIILGSLMLLILIVYLVNRCQGRSKINTSISTVKFVNSNRY